MHLEVLVEDQSGKRMLEHLLPKLVSGVHTYRIHPYKGIGRVPKGMKDSKNAAGRILLETLPRLLKGYGRTFAKYSDDYPSAVLFVCDLDDKCRVNFKAQLNDILVHCNPQPRTCFCFAIEEAEAWLLGDVAAVKRAYSRADDSVLAAYTQDSICGTWEILADAVHPGGSLALKTAGWMEIGKMKSEWADAIAPHIDPESNRSPSFEYFKRNISKLVT